MLLDVTQNNNKKQTTKPRY